MEFIRFLTFALASNHETIEHLETVYETKSLTEHSIYNEIHQRTEHLGKKFSNFLKAVNKGAQNKTSNVKHQSSKRETTE